MAMFASEEEAVLLDLGGKSNEVEELSILDFPQYNAEM